jgi:Zn-dependent protease with chaperone function
MAEGFFGVEVLLLALAIAPATRYAIRSRALVRSLDDPALPERLLGESQRSGQITGTMLVVLAFASPRALWWTLPLMIGTRLAAGYPLRKALFEETWSLSEYLWFVARFTAAIWGFWIALALLPFAPRLAGRFDWLAAAALALLLVVWNIFYGDAIRRLLRARPLNDAALRQDFQALAQTCGLAVPAFEQVDLGGGVIANAIALPSLRGSSVIFTDALLTRLEPAEAAAICAHELAHLEYYNRALLRRLNTAVYGLIGLGVALAVAPRFWNVTTMPVAMVWAAGFMALLIWRARDRQRQETVCDQRAVALCGDVEVVARALTKIHASARLPRRFDCEVERHATHPSLARRLRDIRAAAGAAPVALADTATVASADGKTELTFEDDRLHWREGTHATHSLAYDYLSELRLHVKVKGRATLVAVERGGRRWEASINDADVARVQRVLDVVDARLANPAVGAGPWPTIAKAVLAAAAILALLVGQLAASIAALIALVQPRYPVLAGAGAAALCAAALSFRASDTIPGDTQVPVALLLAAIGVGLLWAARANAEEDLPERARLALAVLGVCAALSTAGWLMSGIDPISLHQSAMTFPSAAVFLIALSAALFCWPSRWARRASVPAAIVALLSAATGSTLFLDEFGSDPFLGDAAPVAWTTIEGEPAREFPLPFHASAIRLSPSGRTVLVTSSDHADDYRPIFHVGRVGSRLSRMEADEIVFADDDRLIVLDAGEENADVREVHVDAPEEVLWQQRVEGMTSPVLSYRPSSRTWQLLGADMDGGIVRASGCVGKGHVETTRWAPSTDGTRWPQAIAASGSQALVVEARYPTFGDTTRMSMLLSMLQGFHFESRLSRVDPSGYTEFARTKFMAQCQATLSEDRLLCSVFDGTRTRFAALDPTSSSITAIAWLRGRFTGQYMSQDGWMSGWLGSEPVAIRAATLEGVRTRRAPGHVVTQVVATGGVIATISYGQNGSVLRFYRSGGGLLHAAGSN